MTSLALPRGQGPAFADLPPTLRPRAIADAAPGPDRLRTAALAGAIYLLLGGGAAALAMLRPVLLPPVPQPPVQWRPVVIDGPTTLPRPVVTVPVRSGVAGAGSDPTVAIPRSQADPDLPAPGLGTQDRSGEAPPIGLGGGPTQGSAGPVATGPASAGTGVVVHDFSMVGLAIRHQVDPIYPPFARLARIQGPVHLQMVVDEQGVPVEVRVLDGHAAFHEAARAAARQWRFEPARMDGRPVMATFRLTLNFRLR